MKTLSVRHPFIDAILAGAKTVEIRSQATRHRGEILLHASRTWGRREQAELARLQRLGLDLRAPAPEEMGAIVGRALIVACRRMNVEDWQRALAEPFEGEMWAWELAEPKRLPATPMQGHLGLFEVDEVLVTRAVG